MSHIDGSEGVTLVLTQPRNSESPSASLECLLELGSLCYLSLKTPVLLASGKTLANKQLRQRDANTPRWDP